MSNNDDHNRLKPSDIKMWQALTRDVKRSKGKKYLNLDDNAKPHPAPMPKNDKKKNTDIIQKISQAQASKPTSKSLDRRTETKLRQGKIRPEATIDLHGMTQDEAHDALIQFIKRCFIAKKRCVLVITGKGLNKSRGQDTDDHWIHDQYKPGILKRLTPNWLASPSMQHYIVKTMPAHAKDGGAGALYVYLHKHKHKIKGLTPNIVV